MPDPESLVARSLDGRVLRLDFHWRGDRYAHQFFLAAAGEPLTAPSVATSVEGSADETWPASPAFQQLLVEDRGARGRVALLVGMSGSNHWSASVEPVPGQAAWLFDVACRVRELPEVSRSTYRRLNTAIGAESHDESAGSIVILPESPAFLRESLDGLSEVVAECRETKTPCTLRWRYVVAVEP